MIASRGWLLGALLAAVAGCSLETGKAGGACERSTQCAAGLACVKGKCGKDLRSVSEMNTVPTLGGVGEGAADEAEAAGGEGGSGTQGAGAGEAGAQP